MCLEATANAALADAEENLFSYLNSLCRLKENINEQVATPLAHALWMAGGSFIDLESRILSSAIG